VIYSNAKMALASIKGTKARSFLTMLGVIIGVASVVIIVALGQGVKKQVVDQINQLGSDIISIRPGNKTSNLGSTGLTGVNATSAIGSSTLTNADIESLKQLPSISGVTYNSVITGVASSYEGENDAKAVITATPPETYQILNQQIEFGEFYSSGDNMNNAAVIGSNVATALYNQRDPIGRAINIKGEDFVVRGILSASPENPLNLGTNYNDVIYIPVEAGRQLTGDNLQISELNVKVSAGRSVNQTAELIRQVLFKNHGGQEDFTIFTQSEYLKVANQAFDLLTTLVAAIAGISLLVGGIGIMNIMLVSVSERTHEIGVRKAIGASNQQILGQFLVESTVISVLGGIIGIILSFGLAFAIRLTTEIHPVISITTVLLATGVSTVVGVIFGMTPAIQAARKDPIEALRHE
jgi:putative ABC transport system permease protein